MITRTRVVVLFLFGATLASSQSIQKLKSIAMLPTFKSTGCPSGPELAPLICKFMQRDFDLQFKPQLIVPSTFVPPLVMQPCDKPEIALEIKLPELIEDKKPIVIPEPPELPPLVIPEFPIPVLVKEPLPLPAVEPCEPAAEIVMNVPVAPELPPLEMPVLPEIIVQADPCPPEVVVAEMDHNTIEVEPIVIPQPPELPAFVMPELPVKVEVAEVPMIVEPCDEIPQIPLVPIPAAPELPPAPLPEVPVRVEIPTAPILPPMEIPVPIVSMPVEEPCITGEILIEEKPLIIPPAPVLSEFVMPELPVKVAFEEPVYPQAPIIIEQPIEEPCITNELVVLEPEDRVIPSPPVLPEFIMPELPVKVIEEPIYPKPAMFIEQPLEEPCVTGEIVVAEPQVIPAAPILPEFVMPELPLKVHVAEPVPMPIIPAFPEPAVMVEVPAEEPCLTNEVKLEIPQPPALPELVMPELPVRLPIARPTFVAEPCEKPKVELNNILIPTLPMDKTSYPVRCVYNLVKEHVIPNMAANQFRPMDIGFVTLPAVPCS